MGGVDKLWIILMGIGNLGWMLGGYGDLDDWKIDGGKSVKNMVGI